MHHGKGFKASQIFVDIFQGLICLFFLQESLESDKVVAVIMAHFLKLVQVVLKGRHLGGLNAGQEPGGPVLFLDGIALGQSGKDSQGYVMHRVNTYGPAHNREGGIGMSGQE